MNEKQLITGLKNGIKVWLLTVIFTPFLAELQLYLDFGHEPLYAFNFKFALLVYVTTMVMNLIFFLFPCMISGVIASYFMNLNRAIKIVVMPMALGLFCTTLGYGLIWYFLLTKSEPISVSDDLVTFSTMLGMQIALWLWVIWPAAPER